MSRIVDYRIFLISILLTSLIILPVGAEENTHEVIVETTTLNLGFDVVNETLQIDGDDDMDTKAGDLGWAGDGSSGSPYEIEIAIDGEPGTHVEINNTRKYFIISGSTQNGEWGIVFNNVSNGAITGVTVSGHEDGILFTNSSSNLISDSTITNNGGVGIHLNSSHENEIDNNNVTMNGHAYTGLQLDLHNGGGMILNPSNSNIITNNNILGNNINGLKLVHSNHTTIDG
ncbi:MAG: NosD domain-containing protein, partial [Candidatus Kariarchaeaceae archaeon]